MGDHLIDTPCFIPDLVTAILRALDPDLEELRSRQQQTRLALSPPVTLLPRQQAPISCFEQHEYLICVKLNNLFHSPGYNNFHIEKQDYT